MFTGNFHKTHYNLIELRPYSELESLRKSTPYTIEYAFSFMKSMIIIARKWWMYRNIPIVLLILFHVVQWQFCFV